MASSNLVVSLMDCPVAPVAPADARIEDFWAFPDFLGRPHGAIRRPGAPNNPGNAQLPSWLGRRVGTLGPITPPSDDVMGSPESGGDTLVARAQAGDQVALDQLLRAHYDGIYAVCRRMAGNDADAADAAQEALIAVVRGLGRFDGRSRFTTWVYRIAVNATIDELRRRNRRPDRSLEDLPVEVAATDEQAVGAETRIDVDAALRSLPEVLRAAVVLRDLCGLDYAEIAEVLDIPPGTVRSRIARARAGLMRALGPTWSVP